MNTELRMVVGTIVFRSDLITEHVMLMIYQENNEMF